VIGATDENTRLLRIIVKLLSLQLTSAETARPDRERNQRERIRLLYVAGFSAGEIADILATTPGTVSVALVPIRREIETKKGGTRAAKKTSGKPKPSRNKTSPLLSVDDPGADDEM